MFRWDAYGGAFEMVGEHAGIGVRILQPLAFREVFVLGNPDHHRPLVGG
jgi:hypothetical protein